MLLPADGYGSQHLVSSQARSTFRHSFRRSRPHPREISRLGAAGIDHDFAVIRGATHEWGLWKDNLAEDLPGIMGVLNA